MKHVPKIDPYVTAKGGVVILNGPFPLDDAERVRALCDAAPDMLEALEEIYDHAQKYGAAPFSASKMFARACAAIAKAKEE